MKIILRKNFDQLGKIGDVLTVKDGYARNFLIPRGIAYIATEGNLKALEAEKKAYLKKLQKEQKDAENLAAELEKLQITIPVKVGEDDKLFGSVTSNMIADEVIAKGVNIDKRAIQLSEPIKQLGIHEVPIKLHTNVTANIKVWVVRE
ncbi:MAG TPA: 50S ribosomal protein L9 [Ignavibacteriales bacterium]|jgi:large subunit ribosomal protein L9|nr:50S ribosomal protein L9 [Ignavibacteriales bacterium]